MPTAKKVASISVSLNPGVGAPQKQSIEIVTKLVAQMLGRAGCERCGRLAFIDLKFLGDPGPDIIKLGGVSMDVREG
jgi:hypothetical protein